MGNSSLRHVREVYRQDMAKYIDRGAADRIRRTLPGFPILSIFRCARTPRTQASQVYMLPFCRSTNPVLHSSKPVRAGSRACLLWAGCGGYVSHSSTCSRMQAWATDSPLPAFHGRPARSCELMEDLRSCVLLAPGRTARAFVSTTFVAFLGSSQRAVHTKSRAQATAFLFERCACNVPALQIYAVLGVTLCRGLPCMLHLCWRFLRQDRPRGGIKELMQRT